MEFSLMNARTPGEAGITKWAACQYHGISSSGYDMPDRKIRPTEKKVIIRIGLSESAKKSDPVSPQKQVASKHGISSMTISRRFPISGMLYISGSRPIKK